MASNLIMSVTALCALVPASLLPFRRASRRPDLIFWLLLAAAVAGPTAYSLTNLVGPWSGSLSMTLWVSIAASLILFTVLSAVTRTAWRLSPLLLPYLLILAVLATIWSRAPGQALETATPDPWLIVHIVVSVLTYALATLAAVAGASVFLQERALKRKQPTGLTRSLPSVAEGEVLELRLLAGAETVLGIGILTGMALNLLGGVSLLVWDHKTLLSLVAFVLIGLLLFFRYRSGLRGRRAARLVLLAYLILTLAYPGVKFVTDVLIT